jgi:hypothetical protein
MARMKDMANPGMGMWVQATAEHTPEFAVLSPNSIAWNDDPNASAYSVAASPSLGTATVSGTTCTFSSSMSAGTEYTFTVTATGGTDFSFKGFYVNYSGSASQGSIYGFIQSAVAYSNFDLIITANGAAAGAGTLDSTGTRGGRIVAKWENVAPFEYLYLYIGGRGGNYCRNTYTSTTCSAITNEGVGGWNGGGGGGSNGGAYQGVGAAGGGATDIRTGGTALSNRILVAGGAGAYTSTLTDNGRGGFADGEAGRNIGSTGALGGGGGTSLAGGAGGARPGYSGGDGGAGSLGSGGSGGNCATSWCMGGNAGGGGYYGGGGGESGDASINNTAAGGGGGSGFMDTSTFVSTTFLDSLNGVGLGSDSNGNILFAWQEPSP